MQIWDRAGKCKLGARAGKYKLWTSVRKYKLVAQAGGQDHGGGPSKGPGAGKDKDPLKFYKRRLQLRVTKILLTKDINCKHNQKIRSIFKTQNINLYWSRKFTLLSQYISQRISLSSQKDEKTLICPPILILTESLCQHNKIRLLLYFTLYHLLS